MILLNSEIFKEYHKKANSFMNYLTSNFDVFYSHRHNDLDSIIDFKNYTDRMVKYFAEATHQEANCQIEYKSKISTIESLLSYHGSNAPFNKDNADRWLLNALELILVKGYEYRPPFFIKNNEKIIVTDLNKNYER